MRSKAVTLIENIVALFIIGLVLLWFIFVGLLHLTHPGQSNESAAIGNLRTVMGSQTAFLCGEGGYAGSWKELHEYPIAAGKPAYLDIDLSGVVQGYNYYLKPAGDSLTGEKGNTVYTDFTCTTIPVIYSEESQRTFFINSTGIIRFEFGKFATKDSMPIECFSRLRSVVRAQRAFAILEHGYASTWEELHKPFADGGNPYCGRDYRERQDGYRFSLQPSGDSLTGPSGTTVYTDFTFIAEPIEYGKFDNKSYFVDSSGIIRQEHGRVANKESDTVKDLEHFGQTASLMSLKTSTIVKIIVVILFIVTFGFHLHRRTKRI